MIARFAASMYSRFLTPMLYKRYVDFELSITTVQGMFELLEANALADYIRWQFALRVHKYVIDESLPIVI